MTSKNLERDLRNESVWRGDHTSSSHFGFPPELHELVCKLNDKISPLDVGMYEWMMTPLDDHPEASFLAATLRDVRYVKFISTFHSPNEILFRRQPGVPEKDGRSCIESSRTTTRAWVEPTLSTYCGMIIRPNAKLRSGDTRCISGSSTTPC